MNSMIIKQSVLLMSRRATCQLGPRCLSLSASRRDIFNVQDSQDFDAKVLKSKEPVVVDFHASWCGPCKVLKPRLEKIVAGLDNKIHLAKVDIDKCDDIAEKFQISAVPTVFAIKNGKVLDQFSGVRDEDQIHEFVEKLIGA